jgi:hypothetical protein
MSGNDKKKSKKTMWIVLIILVVVVIFYLYKQKSENLTAKLCDAGSAPGCIKEGSRFIGDLKITSIRNSIVYARDMRKDYNTCIINFKTYIANNISNLKNNKFHLITYETRYIVDGSARSIVIVFFLNTESNKIYKISRCYLKSYRRRVYDDCDNQAIARIRYDNQTIKDTGSNMTEVVEAYNVNSYFIDPNEKYIRLNDNKHNLIQV